MREYSYEEIKLSTGDFALDHLVGKGSHGSVYKASLGRRLVVAVKKPSVDATKLDKEIKILSSVRSPNIVNLIGISCHVPTGTTLLVTEFMPNGSLHNLLHLSLKPPSWARRTLAALQIARAVLSLHEREPPIVHRDIKSENVLLDGGNNARLSDFSLAVREHESYVPAAGTLGYLDPGYTDSDKLSAKNDVFSFGVLLLEIVSGRKVLDVERDPAWIVKWARPMIREGRVRGLCDGRVSLVGGEMERLMGRVVRVAGRCVSRRGERRPTMREVVEEMSVVAEGFVWMRWSGLRRVCGWGRKWRRRKEKRVTAGGTTKRIACKSHLDVEDEDEDEDDGDDEV